MKALMELLMHFGCSFEPLSYKDALYCQKFFNFFKKKAAVRATYTVEVDIGVSHCIAAKISSKRSPEEVKRQNKLMKETTER